MEPKEIKIERAMYRFYHKVGLWLMLLLLVALVLLELTSCRSTTAAYGTQRTIRDSVAVKYKTVIRDSLRIKDSICIVTKTKVRDSVVLRIDKNTGDVVSREAWHWQDTDNNRYHVAEVGRMVNKADSVAYGHVKTDSVATTKVMDKKAAETNETKKNGGKPRRRLLRSYVAGLLTGGILLLLWKYRRKILQVLKLLIKIVHKVLCL